MVYSICKTLRPGLTKHIAVLTRNPRIHNLSLPSTLYGINRNEFERAISLGLKFSNRTSSSKIFRCWGWSFISPLSGLVTVIAVNQLTSFAKVKTNRITSITAKNHRSIFYLLWDVFLTFMRAIRLGCTFLPLMIVYPLTYVSSRFENIWYDVLVFCLELSGPIFIKLGQWASTRRDLFTEELCNNLARLQTENTPHSWYYTKKTLERAFGNWQEIIVLDSTVPVGSGCCGQVYKAWLKHDIDFELLSPRNYEDQLENSALVEVMEMIGIGHIASKFTGMHDTQPKSLEGFDPVALKLLHPRMTTLLRRDLALMKIMANILTVTIPSLHWLSLPDCVDDFAKLMRAQVNLNLEADNLERFATNFKRMRTVHFPEPNRRLTRPYLLVESYEEGTPMQSIVTSSDMVELKTTLADIGMNTILKMVFDDNFIHGDLHPGNMLVQDLESGDFEESRTFNFWRNVIPTPKTRLTVIDCGIIVTLENREKGLLRDVFTAVADGEGEVVADLFLNNSTHQCKDPASFKKRIAELVELSVDKKVNLNEFAVSSLMSQLFQTLINHKVKIDGCFTAVILAVMVVEGLGRSLDPNMDLVDKAKPYLFKDKLLNRM